MNRALVFAITALTGLGLPLLVFSENTELNDSNERLSYAIGMDIGESLKSQNEQLDLDILELALRAAFSGKEMPIHRDKVESEQRLEAKRAELARINREEGEAFLMVNAELPDVHVTDSGLQFTIIEHDDGPKPLAGSTVTVHYKGMLLDGSEFTSSYKQGKPVTLKVGDVLPGWTEGLQLMSLGARYKFFIPPELAYGEKGSGEAIGPNETLIFEVELLDIDTDVE